MLPGLAEKQSTASANARQHALGCGTMAVRSSSQIGKLFSRQARQELPDGDAWVSLRPLRPLRESSSVFSRQARQESRELPNPWSLRLFARALAAICPLAKLAKNAKNCQILEVLGSLRPLRSLRESSSFLLAKNAKNCQILELLGFCDLCALCESLLLFFLAKIAKPAKDVQLLGVLRPLRSQAARLRHAQPTSARAFVTICSLAKLAKLAKDFQATWGTGSLCDLKLRAFLTRSLALRESSSVFSRQDRQGRQELPNP